MGRSRAVYKISVMLPKTLVSASFREIGLAFPSYATLRLLVLINYAALILRSGSASDNEGGIIRGNFLR